MTNGVKIKYGDVAPGAKENFDVLFSEKEDFVQLNQLQQYNLDFPNYSNPCEYGSVILNSTAVPFDEYPQYVNMGFWSKNISGSNGAFAAAITLSLSADELYTSKGFTFTFDTYNNIFCNSLKITWYRQTEKLDEKTFTPNSAFYFCNNAVENFDKVDIIFYSMNMPYNRLKIRSIDYGYGTIFFGDELRSVTLIQEISPISSELSINTVDFTLESKNDFEYSFDKNQPLQVYFDDELKAVTLINGSKRKSKKIWYIQSEDYVGKLSNITFYGGMYSGGETETAENVLKSIFTAANVPYEIDEDLKNILINGYMPIKSCRDAVQQICFVIGGVCDTACSDKIHIRKLSDEIKQQIPLSRIRQGQSFENSDKITKVQITSYTYLKNTKSGDTVMAYQAEESGYGNNILVKFSEPLHTLSIINGEILESGVNYAKINAKKHCELTGYSYHVNEKISTKEVPLIGSNETETTAEVSGINLINDNNVNEILSRVYNNMLKTQTTRLKIYEGKHKVKYGTAKYGTVKYGQYIYDERVNLGDVITAETEYLGNVTGRIISQRYNLNGGIIVKECELI